VHKVWKSNKIRKEELKAEEGIGKEKFLLRIYENGLHHGGTET